MDIYQSITEYVLNLPVLKEWAEVRPLFGHTASMQPRDWRLPVVICQAVGGLVEQAIPASAALACAQIGIILIDDMLDEDPRGEYHRIGESRTANFASAFISAGSEAILQSNISPETKLAGVKSLSQMILSVAFGQYLDCQNPADEEAYWRIVQSKSAPFFGCAFQLGALFGGASSDVVESVEQIGRLYGEMIQIHDDLNDTMVEPANPDWTLYRSPLPILFAQLVDHPEREKFLELRREISNPDALCEAQNILIRCGAVSYCVDQLLNRYRIAQGLLNGMPLIHREMIEPVLRELVTPVYRIFETLGSPLKDEIIFSAQSEARE